MFQLADIIVLKQSSERCWIFLLNIKQFLILSDTSIIACFVFECSIFQTELLIYNNALLKPIWTYGLQLWGAAQENKTNRNKIQPYQSIVLRKIIKRSALQY